MKLQVTKNEFTFIPEIGGNRQAPEKEQFKIILKKVNSLLDGGKYAEYALDGEKVELKSINNSAFYKSHIVKFINPIKLEDSEGNEILLDEDILFSNTYCNDELDKLLNDLISEINNISKGNEEEKKK